MTLPRDHTFLGMTQSLCPDCLALVPVASRCQPLFFVFGRGGIPRTETGDGNRTAIRTPDAITFGLHDQRGNRTPVVISWPGNADDNRIARLRQERSSGKASRVVVNGQSASQHSPARQQFDDRVPDGRPQAVLVCDQLSECLIPPAMSRPATRGYVVTTFGTNTYGNRTAGAIPAASTSCVTSHLAADAYVFKGRG